MKQTVNVESEIQVHSDDESRIGRNARPHFYIPFNLMAISRKSAEDPHMPTESDQISVKNINDGIIELYTQ